MVQSMTAFAAGTGNAEGASWTIEMRGVNGKGLDIRFRLPERMLSHEQALKARLQKLVARGTINVGIRVDRAATGAAIALDEDVVKAYLSAAIQIRSQAKNLGLKLEPSRASDFLGLRGVVMSGDDVAGLPEADILRSFDEVAASFVEMRATEGAALRNVLLAQLETLSDLTVKASTLAEARKDQTAENLKTNLAAVLQGASGADPDRVAQELALIAVKSDVTEEIDRLGAHVEATRTLLGEDGAIGRKLDFLMQEFNREANTLCAKSGSTELTRVGLDLKAIIDQMREQVQNVE
ncbi:YicC/YloC family endoribonuclease [Litoreibacter roseus]|uniref:YicC family protein n=1 Tax=Litoreibacter roseus TaxID=2601869 RepID=A0A6N6JLE9_9RHOB|nr:YicC/YloC family endoribonuclease [Litoreibacter roseus]GFE66787.1 hypothetical protein KIN_38610 [Litoreibacter roseus]